jgi:hypothetical protein
MKRKEMHATPTMVPRPPSDPTTQQILEKNLKAIGLGSRLLNFTWILANQAMVDKLTQARAILEKVQMYLKRGALHYITE